MFFRLLVMFFTIATIVLLAWSLVGSYKNESYLTNNYLISFQLSNLNLSTIFANTDILSKRELQDTDISHELQELEILEPTKTLKGRDIDLSSLTAVTGYTSLAGDIIGGSGNSAIASVASQYGVSTSALANALSTADTNSLLSEAQAFASTASIPDSVATLLSEITGDLSSVLDNIIANASPSDLGLSDMYAIGFYGYCKGELNGDVESIGDLGELGKQFRNNNVNYTYCSPPEFGYKLDPLALIKHEMLGQIQNYGNGLSNLTGGLTDSFISELLAVTSSLTYDNLGLPGNLKQDLGLLHKVTIAGFSLLFAGACLAFVSFVFQCVGICCSPENSFLSCCNFLLMFFVVLIVVIGAALTTGVFLYVRKIVNQNLDSFGVKTYLSQQFYAFAWCAGVSALLFIVFSIIGYCCGCFHPRKRARRREPEMRYDHKA
ncbi:hypothetical protein HF325_005757 [Metschnikowia pulcherrima]|uniref:SUR7 family protein pun1 n=1 Tax=Metschnikowia pulcherrima TaxID=27326 RepID=A0A8H7L9K8_9ASCO|nr:hypothetical protein HF325_005757 [Metschnikowia pulcherrima]